MRRACLAAALILLAASATAQTRSGIDYQSPETQALQADDFANPGMLWVERGAALWNTPEGMAGKSCQSCHGDGRVTMKGVAVRYPAHVQEVGRVIDLEDRIGHCRQARMDAPALPRESDGLLALTAYVAHASRGLPIRVDVSGPATASFRQGEMLFNQRMGQMNLACRHCHVDNQGRMLRGDRISQGMPTGYPLYRLEWQKLGSLQRRLRFCMSGVRAEPFAYGAQELIDLSLFLANRAGGLALETPGVRR